MNNGIKRLGLSDEEVARRLQKDGYNELPASKPKSLFQIALEVFKEPMFILLVAGGVIYFIIGNNTEGSFLLSSVLVIIFITFYQNQRTERALDTLKKMASPRALVIRNGQECRIAGREVVCTDLILLNEGDRVPADGVLHESNNLSIDESVITGESMPVHKDSKHEIERSFEVFSGTLVVRGSGLMEVTQTGMNTLLGKIGKSLQDIDQVQTNLQRELNRLIRNLFIVGILISLLVIIAFYLTRGQFLHAFLNGLATAMAMLPEEFPVVMTVFLAIGSWRLSQQKVLTRKPSAIETLGSTTVLCSDKTGTITQNKMALVTVSNEHTMIVEDEFDSGHSLLTELVTISFLASTPESIDPMEKAIGEAYRRLSLTTIFEGQVAVKSYPLSDQLFAMSRVYKNKQNTFEVFCKGSPESVMKLCGMSNSEQVIIQKRIQELAANGQRILGLAKSNWSNEALPENQGDYDFKFMGFIGFEDPIRLEVPNAIHECYQAGIKVVMITGDYPETAKSIAKQAGMNINGHILSGKDLEKMSDEELMSKIDSVNVFARIIPEQKLRIIRAFQARGEVVAMTGDGVNDAPALKAADIGIAMGAKGTDVAREASDLVLIDDNFSSIVGAIRQGRRVFDNLQKAMAYIIAIHIPIIGLTLLPAFFSGMPVLLMPLHIAFMELIIDPACSLAFESEREEKGIMQRPPRKSNVAFFGNSSILLSTLKGLFLFGVVIGVYIIIWEEGHSDGEIRAIAFTSLIVGNIFLILTTLSKSRSALSVLLEGNKALLVILFSATTLLLIMLKIPFMASVFSFVTPETSHFIIAIVASMAMLLVFELIKFSWNKRVKLHSLKQ